MKINSTLSKITKLRTRKLRKQVITLFYIAPFDVK